jgi:hypothetical protein
MTRARELVDDAVALLEQHGFVPEVSNGGKHMKIKWRDERRGYTLVISQSPSDRCARQNSLTVLRRILRNGGAR